jgi:hypothetical protein
VKYATECLRNGHHSSVGSRWATWRGRGACFTGDVEIEMKEGSGDGASLYGSSARETWTEGSFTGVLKVM